MRSSWLARTISRTTSQPRRWPSLRGSPRASAQRPFPSGMIAMWRGSLAASRRFIGRRALASSDGEDLLLLRASHLVQLAHELVGELLPLRLAAARIEIGR